MSEKDFKTFRHSHSIFSEDLDLDVLNSKSENYFQLKFVDSGKVSYVEKKHSLEDVQIDTLDSNMDSFLLFEQVADPVDISEFMIVFDPDKGINLYEDAQITNLALPASQLLDLIDKKITNPLNLDEFVEPHI